MDEFKSLDILLNLAAEEAISAGYGEITAAHLLIALARLGDPDASAQVDNAGLRTEFEQLGIEPRRFRRRFRALLVNRGAGPPQDPIHRSPTCKAVFALAEEIAIQQRVALNPEHLLHATLISLARTMRPDVSQESEIKCPHCQATMRPVLVNGVQYCSKCGKQLDARYPHRAPPPMDAIPDEL